MNPPADRTPWQSVLLLWSAERSRSLAAGSLTWAAAGTRPHSPTRSGHWRSSAAPAGSAASRTVRSGPWTLRKDIIYIHIRATRQLTLQLAITLMFKFYFLQPKITHIYWWVSNVLSFVGFQKTHSVVEIFNSELSEAFINQVQFTFSCNCFEPEKTKNLYICSQRQLP